jgi:DNA polymerase elongation subunit (family B)
MLIDYEYKSGNLITSYIDKKGNIKLKYYPWSKPTKYILAEEGDPNISEDFVTWDGKNVKKVYTNHPNRYSVYDFIDALPKEEQELLYEYNEPNIFFIDIETEILDKKPDAQLAECAILSIAIVNKNKALGMGIDSLTSSEIKSIENDINEKYGKLVDKKWEYKYNCYRNEYELLFNFFQYVQNMAVLTGWNFVRFDWAYLVNRFRKVGGDPSVASFTKRLKETKGSNSKKIFDPNKNDIIEIPSHRMVLDYLDLYKSWDQSVKVKESDSLDFVSGEILGDKFGKVSYMGDLKKLYQNSKREFMFYNIVDSILVQLIHEKTKYIDILYGISILSRITVQSAFSTLGVTEGILRKKLRDQKHIILCKKEENDSDENAAVEGSVSGGFVLAPIIGMATWTVCFDFSSLYPTTIRLFNISADSYKGQLPFLKSKDIQYDFDADYSIFNGHKIPIEDTDIKLLTGSVFRNEDGIVKIVMGEVFSERKRNKNMMNVEHEKLEKYKKNLKILQTSLMN